MKRLWQTICSQSGLIFYTAFNYFDKILTFGVPLIVLYIFEDKATYNEIEYIYSIAAIAGVLIELGVKNYFLYAYKEASDRDRLVTNVRDIFFLQFALYAGLGTIIIVPMLWMKVQWTIAYFFILARTLFMYFLSFFAIYYRLIDKPSRIFISSICVNAGTILLLLVAHRWFEKIDLLYFFAGQMLLVAGVVFYFVFRRVKINLLDMTKFIRRSLFYAWPIVLNIFLFMFINNYGKVYARNFLSADEMFQISFVQRLALIIQLAHSSAAAYLSKHIFIDVNDGVNTKIFSLYSIAMFVSTGLVFAALWGINILKLKETVNIDLVTILIVIYTIAWCYTAYFELYVNKMNKNKFILAFSLVSAILFLAVLHFAWSQPLVNITLAMTISMLCNLSLMLVFLFRKGNKKYVEKVLVAEYSDSAV
ncbi:MAG: hypothetical protein NTV06_08135 [candidate division Zixibacteria bacterium]|nr:hypothetical protein [candidate division Zixibacteria bacterium]